MLSCFPLIERIPRDRELLGHHLAQVLEVLQTPSERFSRSGAVCMTTSRQQRKTCDRHRWIAGWCSPYV